MINKIKLINDIILVEDYLGYFNSIKKRYYC